MNNEQRLSDAYSDLKDKYARMKISLSEANKKIARLTDQVSFFADPGNNQVNAKLVYYEQILRCNRLLNEDSFIYKSGYVSAEKYNNIRKENAALVEKIQKMKTDLANMQETRKKLFTDNE